MVTLAAAAGAKVLLLGMRMPPNYGPRLYRAISPGFQRSGARRRRLPWVPFLLTGIALSPSLMQADDIHPNELGQPKLLNNVWPSLKPLLQR